MDEQFAFKLVPPRAELIQLWTPDEIYDRLDVYNIEQFVEDRRVERKSAAVQPRALSEYLSMWSNTQPHGGIIIVGIDDSGRLSGCKKMAVNHKNNLESLTSLCPDARWANKDVAIKNFKGEDDFVMVYRVNYRPDKLVEISSGEAFIREGDKKIKINESLKRELRISKGEIHYELEETTLKYPEDFDHDDINNFCKAFFTNRKLQSDKTKEELLELAKLGKRSGKYFKPNLACALLFARDPRDVIPGARIRVIRYEGDQEKFGQEMNSVYSTFVDGNISKILFNVKPVIASQIRTFQRFTGSGRITLKPEYPEEAWFEAIVNAVAHRSYNMKTQNIFVKIFDDKFVVESPGGFVPPTTALTVYDAHNPRNPYLMEAMMHLELTFCGYEGTRRMRSAMQKARLPEPRFKQIEAHSYQVHVTLENDVKNRKSFLPKEMARTFTPQQLTDLTSDESFIITYLTTKNDVNITEAALAMNKSWPTASKAMLSLLDRGLLELTDNKGKKHDSKKRYRLKAPAKTSDAI